MATIDLGKIKLVWRGTYAGGTAYTVDDVVQHTDNGITSSFICTTDSTGNAPSTGGSVHGSWAYLAKGAAGSVLTTQGDILYRDGSGDQRLAAGTAGQVLQTGGSGANPSWTAVSSDWVKLATTNTAATSVSLDGYFSSDYKAYKILYDCYNTASGTNLGFRAIHSGSVDTNNNYTYCGNYQYRNSSGTGSGDEHSWQTSRIKIGNGGGSNDKRSSGEITLLNPQDSNHKQMFSECSSWNDSGTQYCYQVYGTILTSAALTGFNLAFWGSGTLTPTYVNLYGIK